MNTSSTVLVVIDMQNDFLNDKIRHIISHVVDLVKSWQERGGATLFTRYLNYPGSQYERLIHWTRMQESPETDITPELMPYVSRVIDRTIYSLFNEEGSRAVKEGGWRDLIFCGVATESCVLKSATDAFERDYTPWLVRDASASHAGDEVHAAGLLVSSRFIGRDQIVDAATVLADLDMEAAQSV